MWSLQTSVVASSYLLLPDNGVVEKRRKIGGKLTDKILPAILQQLKARTRGLGHLSVTKAVEDSTNIHNRHVVKSYLH